MRGGYTPGKENAMPKQVMNRKASDNPYLHRDFHGALSCGIEYLHTRYGEEAVRKYLREFAGAFYAPLRQRMKTDGLAAIREHYEQIFREEEGKVQFKGSDTSLTITVKACPAITHMRKRGLPVARMYCETTRVMNEVMCEGSSFEAQLCNCDPERGTCEQRFRRKT